MASGVKTVAQPVGRARGASAVAFGPAVAPPATVKASTNPASQTTTQARVAVRRINVRAQEVSTPASIARVITQAQQATSEAVSPLAQNPLANGALLSGLVFGSPGASLTIPHGLGRNVVGVMPADAFGATNGIYRSTLPTGANAAEVVTLTSPNAGTFAVWVY